MLLRNPDLGSDLVSATVSIWLMGSVGVKLLKELVWGPRGHEWGAFSLHVGRGSTPCSNPPPPGCLHQVLKGGFSCVWLSGAWGPGVRWDGRAWVAPGRGGVWGWGW